MALAAKTGCCLCWPNRKAARPAVWWPLSLLCLMKVSLCCGRYSWLIDQFCCWWRFNNYWSIGRSRLQLWAVSCASVAACERFHDWLVSAGRFCCCSIPFTNGRMASSERPQTAGPLKGRVLQGKPVGKWSMRLVVAIRKRSCSNRSWSFDGNSCLVLAPNDQK